MRKIISMMLCASLCLGLIALSGCGKQEREARSENLMSNITPSPVVKSGVVNIGNSQGIIDYSLELFRQSSSAGENTLVSPLSVLCALAMTANGTDGDTLSQIESVLGMTVEELNTYLHAYILSLPNDDFSKLSLANSVWLKNDSSFEAEESFLQNNADYYGADIFSKAFDMDTLEEINSWVEANTSGMIDNIINDIPEDAVMFLINALAFDAKWQKIYSESDIKDASFTKEDGSVQDIELMYSSEKKYLEDENASGFLKYYEGGDYAFAALLPDEGVSVEEYVASLTGERLSDILSGAQDFTVNAAIPKFETEFDIEMSEVLKTMGIRDAFDPGLADFTRLGTSSAGELAISKILHKTYIAVDEQGTKAGAATAVQIEAMSAPLVLETKTVCLDRPFVYMLIDCSTNVPIFIGTLMEI